MNALERAIRHLRPDGVLIDTRPDASRTPRVIVRGRVVGGVLSSEEVALDDAAADRGVATFVARGALRSMDRGHLWHQTSFEDLRELDGYLDESERYARLTPGTRERIPQRERIVLRRAIKWEIFALGGGRRAAR